MNINITKKLFNNTNSINSNLIIRTIGISFRFYLFRRQQSGAK